MTSFLPALMGLYGNPAARVPTAAEVDGGSAHRSPMIDVGMQAASRPQRSLVNVGAQPAPLPRFDGMSPINAGLAENAAVPQQKGHKGLFPGKDWKSWLGILGDALSAYGGQQPTFGPAMTRLRQQEEERTFDREKWAAQLEADRQARLAPKVEQVGNTLGMFDPSTQQYSPIFTAPQPWELYAKALGHEPGTDGYAQAIEEYRAGTWGDEGVAGRLAVQAPRLDLSRENNIRSTSTSRENNIRSTGVSRENSIRSVGQSNTNNLRSTNTSRDNSVRSNETARRGQDLRGRRSAIIVNPQTGQRMRLENGRWVPVQ